MWKKLFHSDFSRVSCCISATLVWDIIFPFRHHHAWTSPRLKVNNLAATTSTQLRRFLRGIDIKLLKMCCVSDIDKENGRILILYGECHKIHTRASSTRIKIIKSILIFIRRHSGALWGCWSMLITRILYWLWCSRSALNPGEQY